MDTLGQIIFATLGVLAGVAIPIVISILGHIHFKSVKAQKTKEDVINDLKTFRSEMTGKTADQLAKEVDTIIADKGANTKTKSVKLSKRMQEYQMILEMSKRKD